MIKFFVLLLVYDKQAETKKTEMTRLSCGKVRAAAPPLSPSGRDDTLLAHTLEGSD